MRRLDANNVPRDTMKFVELKFSEMGLALERGTVQAAMMIAPAKSEALRAGLVREFADTYLSIDPEFGPLAWVASKSWLEKNPDTAKSLVKGLYATAKWANAKMRSHAPASGLVRRTERLLAIQGAPLGMYATWQPKLNRRKNGRNT